MKKEELIKQLQLHHKLFSDSLQELNEADFEYSAGDEKWTAGQQLEHIVLSVSPLRKALLLPNFVLALIFGKANRASRTYDELVERYHAKLNTGGRASARFTPKPVSINKRGALQQKLQNELDKLCRQIKNLSEEQLDKYILPHPLLGKITLREMFYFTIYHAHHHHRIVTQALKERN